MEDETRRRPSRLTSGEGPRYWAEHPWPDLARWPDKAGTGVVLPLCALADWGLGHALDLEETLAMPLLHRAGDILGRATPLLVLPPLRYGRYPYPQQAPLAIESDLLAELIRGITQSVREAGFRRLVLYNANPWNEPVVDACGRDLRIELGMGLYCVNLAGLGLDLHPCRGTHRRDTQMIATWLYGKVPEMDGRRPRRLLLPDGFEPEDFPRLATPEDAESIEENNPVGFSDARAEAPILFEGHAQRLAGLLREIGGRPALPQDGALPQPDLP